MAGKSKKVTVDPVRPSGNPANNSGGNPGKVKAQGAIPGPTKTGGPVSLKKALAKKSMPGKGL